MICSGTLSLALSFCASLTILLRNLDAEIEAVQADIERAIVARMVPELNHRPSNLQVTSMRAVLWDYFLWKFHRLGYSPVFFSFLFSVFPLRL